MLLVFSSSIFVLVNDVKAVNNAAASSVDMTDCDYIEYVPPALMHTKTQN